MNTLTGRFPAKQITVRAFSVSLKTAKRDNLKR
nr:MAG TPA: hypothetical protein [Caudoviricetes sp.]